MTGKRKDSFRAPVLQIAVSQARIDESVERHSSHCMIAEAIKEAYPGFTYVSVDLATIRATDPQAGLRYIYLTPPRAQSHLVKFDQGIRPEPFTISNLKASQVVRSGTAGKGRKMDTVLKRDRGSSVPVKIGGRTPPIGALANEGPSNNTGKIRRFGLRGFVE